MFQFNLKRKFIIKHMQRFYRILFCSFVILYEEDKNQYCTLTHINIVVAYKTIKNILKWKIYKIDKLKTVKITTMTLELEIV